MMIFGAYETHSIKIQTSKKNNTILFVRERERDYVCVCVQIYAWDKKFQN